MGTKKAGNRDKTISLLLRLGLAFVFLYAGVFSLKNPDQWRGFVPGYLTAHISATIILKVLAIYELALAVWLLSGKHVRYAGVLCVLTLVGIILSNWSQLIVTFRDFGLVFAAIALIVVEN